jgi:hypothetical protein
VFVQAFAESKLGGDCWFAVLHRSTITAIATRDRIADSAFTEDFTSTGVAEYPTRLAIQNDGWSAAPV